MEENTREEFFEDLEEIQKYKSKKKDSLKVTIDLSWRLIGIIVLIFSFIYWGKELLSILTFVFLSLVIMSAVKPVVGRLTKWNISRGWAILISYLLGFSVIAALTSVILIPFVNQVGSLVNLIPELLEKYVSDFKGISFAGFSIDSNMISTYVTEVFKSFSLQGSIQSVADTIGSVFNFSTFMLAAIFLSLYLVLDHDSLLEILLIRIINDEKRNRVKKLVLDVEHKLGSWLLGQATVSGIAGLVLGIVLWLLGVPYALPLAVLVALFDAIPNIGATIATIPAVLVALLINGPINALIILIIFVLYQQLENNWIIPKVMGGAVGVRPILVMFTAFAFFILMGIWGAILSVPVLVILQILYEFYIDLQKLKAKGSI